MLNNIITKADNIRACEKLTMHYSTKQGKKNLYLYLHYNMLIETESIKNMLNYIERTNNFPVVIRL